MGDFNVKLTVRSERVLAAIENKFGSQAEMSRKTGINSGRINSLVTLKVLPVNGSGWTDLAEDMASSLGVHTSDLWPDHMRDVKLKKATADLSLDFEQVKAIATSSSADTRMLLGKAAKGVRDRNMVAITMQIGGATLDDIGKELGVSRERARQILFRGLRKMKENMKRLGVNDFNSAIKD